MHRAVKMAGKVAEENLESFILRKLLEWAFSKDFWFLSQTN